MMASIMHEIERSNDWVRLSWLKALLADAGIEAIILDTHSSVVQGSIGMVPQRLMVLEKDAQRALSILRMAGEWQD